MSDDFAFRVPGVPVLMSIKDLDDAMRGQFEYEIVNIDNRLVEIFDNMLVRRHDSRASLGKMRAEDAVKKFG